MDAAGVLRHQLATLEYRTSKALTGAPDGFGGFAAGEGVRTPVELLRHMTMLVRYSRTRLTSTDGSSGEPVAPGSIEEASAGLRAEIVGLIRALEGGALSDRAVKLLVQGPLSDALTHTGQLALLRRLAGSPIPGESYVEAEIDADALVGEGSG